MFSVIEHSLASLAVPELEQERVRAIKAMPSAPRRFGALALHNLTSRYPVTATRVLDRRLERHGLVYVGSGYDADVYRREDRVVKVLRRTAQMTEADRQDCATRTKSQNQLLEKYMGAFLIPQTTSIDAHPFIPSQRTVQIDQPYVAAKDLGLFQTGFPSAHPDALAKAVEATPGIENALRDFCSQARSLYESTGAVPDTNGRSNVLVTQSPSPEVVLIDGQPIDHIATETVTMILGQIGALENALSDYK